MEKKPSVHIFHISEFGGHSQAAQNIKEAILVKNKDRVEAVNLNSFQYLYPRTEKFINFIYTIIIKKIPSLWGKAYDRRALVRYLSPWRVAISLISFPRLNKYIRRKKPDCFIATQAFPCGLVADYKKKYKVDIPLVAVVTDFYPHRFWLHPFVDKYVVASEEAKQILIKEGISQDKVCIFGIPISIKFIKTFRKEEVAAKWGFLKDLPAVLIMGGGLGIGPIEESVISLDSIEDNFQIIVICGKNRFLYQKLQKKKKRIKKPLFIFSYIDDINEIMDFSDIIITKAGGITISEALTRKIAIIVTNPIPGQEELNVDFLIRKKAILRADASLEIKKAVAGLLQHPEKLRSLQESSRENVFRDSSFKIADLIDSLIKA